MNELSKNLYCIVMRNGVEIWVEHERAVKMQGILEKLAQHMFIAFDERTINTADVLGVFTARDMEEHTRRRNGEWKCQDGEWHGKGHKCVCTEIRKERLRIEEEQRFLEEMRKERSPEEQKALENRLNNMKAKLREKLSVD